MSEAFLLVCIGARLQASFSREEMNSKYLIFLPFTGIPQRECL